MKNRMLSMIAVLGFAAVLVPSQGFAQAPPMDMSWAIQSQMRLQQQGDAAAQNAAMMYYNYMQQLRRAGYTGPSLPTGVTAQSLQQSIQGANAAAQRYIQGSQVNSNRQYNAVRDYDYRAVRGCSLVNDGYGHQWYACQ